MADWIKVEKSTPRKQEIAEIARALHISTYEAFVRCFLVWSWADTESEDGFLKGTDLYVVDSVAGRRGYGDVMVKVGWLIQRDGGLEIPDFEKHMGQSKKKRERQKRWRAKKKEDVGVSVGVSVASTSISLSSSGTSPGGGEEKLPILGRGGGDTVEAVAQLYCFQYCGTVASERNPYQIAKTFQEWITKLGVTLPKLREAIEDKHRDRTEPNWQLKDRLCGKAKSGATLGPSSRVSASSAKLAAYDAKTVRISDAPAVAADGKG